MRVAVLFLLLIPPCVRAQTPVLDSVARLKIGRTVRVTDSGGGITFGELRSIDRDTLTIAEALSLRQIDERAVKLFELRSVLDPGTRHKRAWFGGVAGLVIGAGIGYLVAVPRVRATERNGDGPFQQIEYVFDPAIGGVLGAIVGGIVGARGHEHWQIQYRAPGT
jgi:hypothetical protein